MKWYIVGNFVYAAEEGLAKPANMNRLINKIHRRITHLALKPIEEVNNSAYPKFSLTIYDLRRTETEEH